MFVPGNPIKVVATLTHIAPEIVSGSRNRPLSLRKEKKEMEKKVIKVGEKNNCSGFRRAFTRLDCASDLFLFQFTTLSSSTRVSPNRHFYCHAHSQSSTF